MVCRRRTRSSSGGWPAWAWRWRRSGRRCGRRRRGKADAGSAAAGGGGDRRQQLPLAPRGRRGGGVGRSCPPGRGEVGGGEARLRYLYATFQQLTLPSPYHPPTATPGRPFPAGADIRALWDLGPRNIDPLFRASLNTHRAALGLAEVDDVLDYVITDRPLLATDPVLIRGRRRPTSTSCRPARGCARRSPAARGPRRYSLTAANRRSTWASAACPCVLHDPREVVVETIRRLGRRMVVPQAGPAWTGRATTASSSARPTTRRCSAGGRRRAPRRRGHHVTAA